MRNPTLRFSNRVENYVKYRPGYPAAVVDFLKEECRLTADSVIADVGSGTGILSELFLRNGNFVYGIEPNREMREAGEDLLKNYPRFQSVAGAAEATTLEDHSVDFITAGRAFHWFDRRKALAEFSRVLKPEAWAVIVWMKRRTASAPVLAAYERLLQTYSTDYEAMISKRAAREYFLGSHAFRVKTLAATEAFDYERLKGLVLSLSISPEASHPNYASMLEELSAIFHQYQQNGTVTFEYDTTIYYGQPETFASSSGGRKTQ